MNINLYITGIKHCGKSTTARILADKLNLEFHDLDHIIEELAGCPVRELYKSRGKEEFMKKEQEAVSWLNNHKNSFICATGGGIADNPEALKQIREKSILVYIDEEPEVLWERIIRGGVPAFLKSNSPQEEFKELCRRRQAVYDQTSTYTVKACLRSPDEIAREIAEQLQEV